MKRTLIGPAHAHHDAPCTDDRYEEAPEMRTYEMINEAGQVIREIDLPEDGGDISDGYHTFGELYDHRRALTAALVAERADISWRSKAHHPDDDPMFEGGYFIVGIELPTGTITYHYKLSHWEDFAAVPELEHAPKWDGAAPDATVSRLLEFAASMASVSRCDPSDGFPLSVVQRHLVE